MGKWTIVGSIFFIHFIDLGIIKSFSALLEIMAVQLQSDIGTIGTILGMYHGLATILAPFITPILKYIPVKGTALISFACSLSIAFLSVPSNIAFFAAAAIFSGICYAFVVTHMMLRMCTSIDEGFALAYGIVNSGAAAGMMILPVFAERLNEVYGWRGTIAILGALSLHVSVMVLLVGKTPEEHAVDAEGAVSSEDTACRTLDRAEVARNSASLHETSHETMTYKELDMDEPETKDSSPSASSSPATITAALKRIWSLIGLSILTELPYTWVIMMAILLMSLVNTAWVIFLIPHGIAKGYPLSRSVFLAFIGGIGQFVGRIAQGPIIDCNCLTSISFAIILSLTSALSFFLDPSFNSFEVVLVIAFIGGMVNGARLSITVVMLKQFIPREYFEKAYAVNCLFFGLAEPLGGLITGYIAGATNFSVAYYVIGSLDLVLAFMLFPTLYLFPKLT